MEIHHILAPTDFSAHSKQALAYALGLAKHFGAKLSILHVVEIPPYPVEGYAPPSLAATFLDDLERQAREELAQLLPEAAAEKVEVVRLVTVGSPYRKILEAAEGEHVDLLVMATIGRTGISRLVMGSVAERVVRHATCPVLTIRAGEEEATS
jgi:nucleotide-binding universal stress UspA family protein